MKKKLNKIAQVTDILLCIVRSSGVDPNVKEIANKRLLELLGSL